MKDFWLRIKLAFWLTQAYLHQFTDDEQAVKTAKTEANRIEWDLKWRINN